MSDLPINPYNPLGFDPESYQKGSLCTDFHKTLGWIFWVSQDLVDKKEAFEYVRHIRHLMLMGMSTRNMSPTPIRAAKHVYSVEIATINNVVGIILEEESMETHRSRTVEHTLSEVIITKSQIYKGVMLNRKLEEAKSEDIAISPFGPRDIVMPPNVRPPFHKGIQAGLQFRKTQIAYRTVRLDDDRSEAFVSSRTRLNNCDEIAQIQIMFSDLPLMLDKDFNEFIHLAAARVHKILRNKI
jgi:hypothetical protein